MDDRVSSPGARAGVATVAAPSTRTKTLLRRLTEAAVEGTRTHADRAVAIAQAHPVAWGPDEIATRLRRSSATFCYRLHGVDATLTLLVDSAGAPALAHLAVPQVEASGSGHRIAEALPAAAERIGDALTRMLRQRSKGRLAVESHDAQIPPDLAGLDAAAAHFGHEVVLRADGLSDIALVLLTSDTDTQNLLKVWSNLQRDDSESLGALHCFVSEAGARKSIERAAHLAELRLTRYPGADAPNPGSLPRGALLALDVPVGHERRFDWCRRLKIRRPDLQVLLLIHHPSRNRVLRGCLARADALLGWPADEAMLTQRLEDLIDLGNTPD